MQLGKKSINHQRTVKTNNLPSHAIVPRGSQHVTYLLFFLDFALSDDLEFFVEFIATRS